MLSYCQFLHTQKSGGKRGKKGSNGRCSTGRRPILRGELANTPRCVGRFCLRSWQKPRAKKCAKTRWNGRFCKQQMSILNSYFLIFNCNILCISLHSIWAHQAEKTTQSVGEGLFGDSDAFSENAIVSKMTFFLAFCQKKEGKAASAAVIFFYYLFFVFHLFFVPLPPILKR